MLDAASGPTGIALSRLTCIFSRVFFICDGVRIVLVMFSLGFAGRHVRGLLTLQELLLGHGLVIFSEVISGTHA